MMLLIIVLLLVFGGGFPSYYGSRNGWGGGYSFGPIGLILVVILVLYLLRIL